MHSEFNYGPAYFPGLIGANGRLTAFCKGNSSTQSNPNNSQTVTDNRTAAADGSLAATNGASITVNSTDGDVLTALSEDGSTTAKAAIQGTADASKTAVAGITNVANAALNSGVDIFREANTTVRTSNDNTTDLAREALRGALVFAEESQKGAVQSIGSAYQGFTNKLSDNAGIAPSSQVDNIVKYVTIAAAVVGLGIAYASYKKGRA